jgi:hypothetical protein
MSSANVEDAGSDVVLVVRPRRRSRRRLAWSASDEAHSRMQMASTMATAREDQRMPYDRQIDEYDLAGSSESLGVQLRERRDDRSDAEDM